MSNRARLLLLSGVGGSGVSTIALATVDSLREEGLSPVLIDASSVAPASDDIVALASASIGRLLADVGADPLAREAWTALPEVARLSALERIASALSDPEVDVVVVDAGDLRRARELIEAPGILLRLLDALLTPRLAMWRAPGGAAAVGEPAEGADTAFEALSRARGRVVRLQQMLHHPRTTARLVTVPEQGAVTRTLRAVAAFSMLGVGVDGIAANRFPKRSEGWPEPLIAEAGQQFGRLRERPDGCPAWKSSRRIRPVPKGHSAAGPLGRLVVLDASELVVTMHEEEFTLDIPLVGAALDEARIGRVDAELIVEFDGAVRWLPLPPVLRRCHATEAERLPTGLRLHFVPDAAVWPTDRGSDA